MLKMFKGTVVCPLCNREIKEGEKDCLPPICSVCASDLASGAETLQGSIECEHFKGMLGTGDGELFVTNKRVFWLKLPEKLVINVPLEEVDRIEDCKKLFRKGVTLFTKSGESYNFFIVNMGNPQPLKNLLAPCVRK